MYTSTTHVPQATVLRMKEIWIRLGVSRSKGYELLRNDPNFPPRVSLGPRARGVISAHLDAYVASLVSAR